MLDCSPDEKSIIRALNRALNSVFKKVNNPYGDSRTAKRITALIKKMIFQKGLNVKKEVISRGVSFLDTSLVEKDNQPDIQAWMLHALSASHHSQRAVKVSTFQSKAFDNLWNDRDKLNAYTRALLALCARAYGYTDKTQPKGQKDFKKLDDMIKQGLNRLYDFQRKDGGWGWWKEGADPATTAGSASIDWRRDLARRPSRSRRCQPARRSVAFTGEPELFRCRVQRYI